MRVVLIGAGHAHLHIAARAQKFHQLNDELILIDPGAFWYSGMASGLLGGQYSPADDRIDPKVLIEQAGGQFIAAQVVGIDQQHQSIQLDNGQTVDYDYLSLNVGSTVDVPDELQPCLSLAHVFCAKPIAQLADLHERIQRGSQTIAVLGGGPTGVELSANAKAANPTNHVTLMTRSARLLHNTLQHGLEQGSRSQISAAVQKRLEAEGIHCEFNVHATAAICNQFDSVLVATGLRANPMVQWLDPAAGKAGLAVNGYLQSLVNPNLFAIGDCADFQPERLPNLGVFGVRAAPVLLNNLLACVRGESQHLQAYQPQQRWLSIMNLGNGKGLLLYRLRSGRYYWMLNRLSLWLKHWLDTRFMRQYRR